MPSPTDLVSTDLADAVERLRRGGLVALPTETVYGLAADAERRDAVARIFAVKGRPIDHPLIVHIAGIEVIDGWVARVTPEMRRLAAVCWPGPLTMLVPRGPRVDDAITGGRPTVGIRVPAHPIALDLLERFGGGLAAPSANRFGRVSPTSAQHVVDDLGDRLDPTRDLVVDGGACPVGVESTIVDLTVSPCEVLRAGAIDATDIGRILSEAVAHGSGPSRASGMLPSHYAPSCDVILAATRDEADHAAHEQRAQGRRVRVLDRTDDLVLAARELYGDLRRADVDRLDGLIVVLPPAVGIGHALRDRLTKAASSVGRAGPSRAD